VPRPWPRWRKVMAYAVPAALALLAVYLVDRRVDELAEPPRTSGVVAPDAG